jgi:hypothetical protein
MSIKKLFSTKKRIAAVVLSGAVLLGTGGIAAAYFSTSGTGTGAAATGSSTGPLTITQVGTVTGLLPGGPAGTINYSVKNTSAGAQFVGPVTVTVTAVTTGSIAADEACATSMYVTTPGAALGSIAPGATVTGTATIQMKDDGKNQDNCQAANSGGALTLGFSA